MKTFAIVLAVCVASTFAGTLTEQQQANLRQFREACIIESGVTPAAVDNAKKGIFADNDPKLACFASCLLKKIGFMTANGTFDEARFRATVPTDIPKQKVDSIVQKCGRLTGANMCETGGKLLKCYLEQKTVYILQ